MPWNAWLRYTREEPPTPEELERHERGADALAERVRRINEEDARLRIEEMAEKQLRAERGEDEPVPTRGPMEALMDGMGRPDAAPRPQQPQPRAQTRPDRTEQPQGTSSGEAEGMGDSFKPGTWSPDNARR